MKTSFGSVLITLVVLALSPVAKAEYFSVNTAGQLLQHKFIRELLTNRRYMASRFETLDSPDGKTGVRAIIEATGTLTGETREQMQFCVFYVAVLRDPKSEKPKTYDLTLEKKECSVIGELPRRQRR